jgi:hypothetical protein
MIVRSLALALVFAALVAGVWQQRRYLRIRRKIVGDRQPLLYPGRTFHALTLVKVGPERRDSKLRS